jgi:N-glycosylase/DNA lyase
MLGFKLYLYKINVLDIYKQFLHYSFHISFNKVLFHEKKKVRLHYNDSLILKQKPKDLMHII